MRPYRIRAEGAIGCPIALAGVYPRPQSSANSERWLPSPQAGFRVSRFFDIQTGI